MLNRNQVHVNYAGESGISGRRISTFNVSSSIVITSGTPSVIPARPERLFPSERHEFRRWRALRTSLAWFSQSAGWPLHSGSAGCLTAFAKSQQPIAAGLGHLYTVREATLALAPPALPQNAGFVLAEYRPHSALCSPAVAPVFVPADVSVSSVPSSIPHLQLHRSSRPHSSDSGSCSSARTRFSNSSVSKI